MDELLLVEEVVAEIIPGEFIYTRIRFKLEDGRYFYLYNIPFDIAIALKKMNGEEIEDDRERLMDILMSMPDVLEILGRHLKRVIINDIDYKTGAYSAIAEFSDGNMYVRRKMVPSHAVFLAKLVNKPIYVRSELVDQQEEFRGYRTLEDEYDTRYERYDEQSDEFAEDEYEIDDFI
ncbi:MAG: bifunctional nuclease family protein [Staphylothermus sp.]|nr:bifunctional nuclease family protein [Staphylothermus sp.]